MFFELKNKFKKLNLQLQYDFVLKIFVGVALIFSFLFLHYFNWGFVINMICIFLIQLLSIFIPSVFYITFKIKKATKNINVLNIKNNLKEYFKYEEIEEKNLILSFLKTNNIVTKTKLKFIINEFKTENNNAFKPSEKQSLGVLVISILAFAPLYYNESTKNIDLNILGIGISFLFIFFMIYCIISCFYNIFFKTSNINEKIFRWLIYFYLNFEKYENNLKK